MLSQANRLMVAGSLIAGLACLLAGCGSGGGSGGGALSGTFLLSPQEPATLTRNGIPILHILDIEKHGPTITGTLDGTAGEQVNGSISGPHFALRLTRDGRRVGFLNGKITGSEIRGTLSLDGVSEMVTGEHPTSPNPDIAGAYTLTDVTGSHGPFPLSLRLDGNTVTANLMLSSTLIVLAVGIASGDTIVMLDKRSTPHEPDIAVGRLTSSTTMDGVYLYSDDTGVHTGSWHADKTGR